MNSMVLPFIHVLSVLAAIDQPNPSRGSTLPTPKARDLDGGLIPERGLLFESAAEVNYQTAIVDALLSSTTINRECQMVAEGDPEASKSESATFIERDNQGHNPMVVKRVSKSNIRDAVTKDMTRRDQPDSLGQRSATRVKSSDIREYRAPISEATAALLDQACEMMIGSVHYPTRSILVTHARVLHFAHHDTRHGYRAGKALTTTGPVGVFVRLLEKLGAVAESTPERRVAAETDVRREATSLIQDLSASGIPVPEKADTRSVPDPGRP